MLAYQQGVANPPPKSSDYRPIEKLVIMVAMPEEARPIISALNLRSIDIGMQPKLQLETYQGEYQGKTFHLVVNGMDPIYHVAQVGTEFAAVSAYRVITALNPDTIISAGTAGGYDKYGAKIGDVIVSRGHFFFHDHDIPVNSRYVNYGKGCYPSLEAPAMTHYLQLKSGIISTGNSLTLNRKEQRRIDEYGAIAKEMEVAAIAKIAHPFNIRVMAVKAITNIVGFEHNAAAEFNRHFETATHNLGKILPGIIRYIFGKTPYQLQNPLSIVK